MPSSSRRGDAPRARSGPPPQDERPVALRRRQAVPPPRPGDVLLSRSLSPAGEAVSLWASAAEAERLRGRDASGAGASFPRSVLERPAEVVVTLDAPEAPEARQVRSISGVSTCFPAAHAMPDDQLLIVGARARYRGGDPEHNALLFSASGEPLRSACIGDGVQAVSTTASGAIWVGYFDEGVFGNYGWGDEVAPMGAPGLNRFDAALALTWSHPGDGEIADCYALSTTGEDCWLCPYTDWPIQRIAGAHLERWKNTVGGAHALVAVGRQVALVGGYSGERDRLVAGTLEGDVFRPAAALGRLALEGDALDPQRAEAQLLGRDGVLHAFAGDVWYVAELWQLMDALG